MLGGQASLKETDVVKYSKVVEKYVEKYVEK